jgi:hypothetical protein
MSPREKARVDVLEAMALLQTRSVVEAIAWIVAYHEHPWQMMLAQWRDMATEA